MHYWKSSLLLLAGVMLSACSSGGGDDTDETMTASSDPTSFYTHTAVFQNNTTVYTWGNNESGQLGNGTTSRSNMPVLAARFGIYSSGNGVATGTNHTLAFQKYSTIRAWGFNRHGQLGNGLTTDNQTPNSKVPVAVRKKGSPSSLSGVTAVAAGGYFSLAVDRDGYVWSWGSNAYGQLGRQPTYVDGKYVNMSSQTAGRVQTGFNGPLTSITSVAAGSGHSIALANDGTVWAWGANGFGQVGDGSTTRSNRVYPEQVTNLATHGAIVKIAAGGIHSLALSADGSIWAWGYNEVGQLGNGKSGEGVYSAIPEKIAFPQQLSSSALIAAGLDHSLAYDPVSDTLYAWGFNLYGQLGTGTTVNSSVPVAIPNFSLKILDGTLPASLIASGHHSHARKTDGSWWSWGDNVSGQLGNGSWTNSSVPVAVK